MLLSTTSLHHIISDTIVAPVKYRSTSRIALPAQLTLRPLRLRVDGDYLVNDTIRGVPTLGTSLVNNIKFKQLNNWCITVNKYTVNGKNVTS